MGVYTTLLISKQKDTIFCFVYSKIVDINRYFGLNLIRLGNAIVNWLSTNAPP